MFRDGIAASAAATWVVDECSKRHLYFWANGKVVACGRSKARTRDREEQEYVIVHVPGLGNLYSNFPRQKNHRGRSEVFFGEVQPYRYERGMQIKVLVNCIPERGRYSGVHYFAKMNLVTTSAEHTLDLEAPDCAPIEDLFSLIEKKEKVLLAREKLEQELGPDVRKLSDDDVLDLYGDL